MNVKFKGHHDILRSFYPKFRSTTSMVKRTGKILKREIILGATVDSGRFIRSVDGKPAIKGDSISYEVSIDTRRSGAIMNYAWFFLEDATLPKGQPGKLAVIPKWRLSPKERQYPVIAKQLDNKKDAVFFKRRRKQKYNRVPYINAVIEGVGVYHKANLPAAIVADMMRKGR